MIITIFKELYKTDVPYHVSIEKIINRIKTGKSKLLIDKIRVEENKEQRNKLKTQLPCILFAGTFSQRNKKSLINHSGLMVVDFDEIDNINEYKEILKNNEYFYLIFNSPSGNGLKGVVKIPPCNIDDHSNYFKKFTENLDFVDSSGSDASRVCFESYDENIYINENSNIFKPILIDKGYHVSEKIPLIPITDEDKIIEMIMSFQWSKDFKEGERNAYIFDLAGAFCEYGVTEYSALNFIQNHINLDASFSELECEKTIKSAYKLRAFGSKYFEDYKKKEIIISDLKHDKKEVLNKHKITEEIYNQISEQSENIDFWFIDNKKNIKIDAFKYKFFLESNGFRKYFPNDVLKPQLLQVNSNKVKDTSPEIIRDFVLNWLLEKKEIDVWKRCVDYQNLFSDNYLSMLETIDLMILKDEKDKCFVSFQNGIIEVTKDNVNLVDYIDVDGYIWENSIIKRDFEKHDIENDYKKFIYNVSNSEPEAIECIIGYLICNYKNKMNNKAIILNDEVISENPEGGTGKGVFVQGIKQIRKTAILDGKEFDDKKSFPYQTVSQDTSVLVFDDVKKNFNFESKFSLVTEGLTLERKNKDAIKLTVEESPKIVISTNYAIKGEGNSHDRRRHEIEFSQYYNGLKTPFDEFKRQLFDDWTLEDFKAFDNYMVKCIQLYLKKGLIEQNAKNIKLRKFIAETSMEFYEWVNDKENIIFNIRLDKVEKFEAFINEYQDYKKFLSRKKFNIWMQKYSKFINLEYEEGNTNGNRWFMIKNNNEPIIKDNNEMPF